LASGLPLPLGCQARAVMDIASSLVISQALSQDKRCTDSCAFAMV